MILVTNTSPLIGLCKGNVLWILEKLFDKIYTSPGVFHEIVVKGKDLPGGKEIKQASKTWLSIVAPSRLDTLTETLTSVDKEVIALAIEKCPDYLLVDERKLISCAQKENIPYLETLDVLYLAYQRQFIPHVKPIIKKMYELYHVWGALIQIFKSQSLKSILQRIADPSKIFGDKTCFEILKILL